MKPKMNVDIFGGIVSIEDTILNIRHLSATEFADVIIERWEHLWTADEVNETRKDLIQLHKALSEV